MKNIIKTKAGWAGKALVLLGGTALTVALFTSPSLAEPRNGDRGSRNSRISKQVTKEKQQKVRNKKRLDRRRDRVERRRDDRRRDRVERRGRTYRRQDLPRQHRNEKFFRYDRRHHRSVFYVPRSIRGGRLAYYRPFYQGRVYHRAHHHYHNVYYFPVYTEFGYAYAPHYYCDGGFAFRGGFVDDDIHGRFSISIGF